MSAISPDDWRARGDTFAWRGERIFYRIEGAGDPVLLVHGFPTSSWDWSAIWPRLAARYRLLTLDMIGFGFSAKPRRFAYSISAQADLFGALLERERISSYRLIAHDYGDTVAQELLARQQDPAAPRIVAACLLNGGLFPEAHRALVTQKLLATPLGSLLVRLGGYRAFARSMRRIWGARPVPDAELRAMWRLIVEHDGTAVLPKLIGYLAERRAHRDRWVGALTGAAMPVRFIDGLVDPISGAHMVARYRELVPHPDVIELPGVGHYPQLEAPDAVASAILDHFGRTP
ncbi:MAG TPA: alpha/beta hydrolase [Kofleriaceae bacterium]|nr:alpha/beta hydrolase [Kofleriaceae bacterium]